MTAQNEINEQVELANNMRHGMNFHSCEKQIFKSFGCTKIFSDSKRTKTSQNGIMQSTISNNNSIKVLNLKVLTVYSG